MSAETPRAPRVDAPKDSLAAAFAAASSGDRRSVTLDEISKFSLNSCTPFSGSPIDLVHDALSKAHALTIVLSIALDASDHDMKVRPVHASVAVDAIGSLIALAAMASGAA